ncbi:hypothetical protein GA0115261_114863, partial [Streptomyces sp. OspMP-M43]
RGRAAARAVAEYESFATSLAGLRRRARHGAVGPDFGARERELLHHLWQRREFAAPALTHAAHLTGRPGAHHGHHGRHGRHGQHGHPRPTPHGSAYGYGYGYGHTPGYGGPPGYTPGYGGPPGHAPGHGPAAHPPHPPYGSSSPPSHRRPPT